MGNMSEARKYQLALYLAKGVGDMFIRQLVSYCGSPEAVFKSKKSSILKIPGVGKKIADAISEPVLLDLAERELEKVEKKKIDFSFYTDKTFPDRLKVIRDAPSLLFYNGKTGLNFKRSVAIVGTRKATQYGKEITEDIVQQLGQYKPVIISGLAYGIDIAAHRAALRTGLETAAIVASGLDIVYPAAHKTTALEIVKQGVIVSENKLGTKPDAHFFPARNRIIAGLADLVIVVEAADRGGALITANIANSYNKDVIAVPGSIGESFSAGCNQLIRDNKAHIYTGISDIEMLTNWDQESQFGNSLCKNKKPDNLSLEEEKVFDLLQEVKDGIVFDDIAWKCQIQVNQLASMLLGMEFKGVISAMPGKKYKVKAGV